MSSSDGDSAIARARSARFCSPKGSSAGSRSAWASGAMPRLLPTADLAHRYARVAGRDLSALPFYPALGYFKIAVIAEGIHSASAGA